MKLFDKVKIDYGKTKEREIRFLNIPIIQYGKKEEKNGNIEKYLDLFPKKGFQELFFDEIINIIGDSYTDYYIFRAGTGDFYIFNYYVESVVEKNKSKNPIFITKRKNILELAKLMNFPYEIVHYDFNLYKSNIFEKTKYKNKTFIAQHSRKFVETTYLQMSNIKDMLYKDMLYKDINLKEILNKQINQDNIRKISQKYNFDLNNFIYIIPHAISCKELSTKFWNDIINRLEKKGYDVIINTTSKDFLGKKILLNYTDLMSIISNAKAIIGLRSGLIDCISWSDIPMYILYTRFNLLALSPQKALNVHTLKGLPHCNYDKVSELIVDETTNLNEIINKIVEEL